MSPLDVPLETIPPDQVAAHLDRVKEFISTTDQPNAMGADGRTCLFWAFTFCLEPDGEERVAALLKRGANPNLPTALANFVTFMTAAKRTDLLELMLEAGLELNGIYEVDSAFMPTQRAGHCTLLDYAMDVEAYLNKRSQRSIKLIEKHAGPLTGRRLFVAKVIAMLKAREAACAMPVE